MGVQETHKLDQNTSHRSQIRILPRLSDHILSRFSRFWKDCILGGNRQLFLNSIDKDWVQN